MRYGDDTVIIEMMMGSYIFGMNSIEFYGHVLDINGVKLESITFPKQCR